MEIGEIIFDEEKDLAFISEFYTNFLGDFVWKVSKLCDEKSWDIKE